MLPRGDERPKVNLFLVKPSSYDDEGYVVRYFRGVLPSNTLACLAALTERAKTSDRLAGFDIRVHLVDEIVSRVNVRKIARTQRGPDRTIVCLVGVQTNQFPRAADLAKEFRREGVAVLIGGFHVSGFLKMVDRIPDDIQELIDAGVTIVKGEVEETWERLLDDAIRGNLQPVYDFLDSPPDLFEAPIPIVDRRYLKRFVFAENGTVDCSRGCPYKCSFCTIINVQGRRMRLRSPESIRERIRENYRRSGTLFYFFTDDNFARNRNWSRIFDILIDLREKEGIPVTFMMQVDMKSHRTEGFVQKAARAGCLNVFLGMESLNPANLEAAGKNQNVVDDFRNLVAAYRSAGIWCHAGYIIGLPFDTPESVMADVKRLMSEVEIDMASFFVLTPLPGSEDHVRYLKEGIHMDPDYNHYDSFRETMHHPAFPEPGSLTTLFHKVWKTFYSFENMSRILNRCPDASYWNLFFNLLWYRASLIEKRHPMTAGFFRLKGRSQVSPRHTVLSRSAYFVKRWREVKDGTLALLSLILEMQLLWLHTRKPYDLERRVLAELGQLGRRKPRFRDLQRAYERVSSSLPFVRVPSGLRLFLEKWSPFSLSLHFYRPDEILLFWNRTVRDLRTGQATSLFRPSFFKRLWLDSKLTVHFMRACFSQTEVLREK